MESNRVVTPLVKSVVNASMTTDGCNDIQSCESLGSREMILFGFSGPAVLSAISLEKSAFVNIYDNSSIIKQ